MKLLTITFKQEEKKGIIIKYDSEGFTKLECIGLLDLATRDMINDFIPKKGKEIKHDSPYDLNKHGGSKNK